MIDTTYYPYETIGNLTINQFNALEILINDGPCDIKAIHPRVFHVAKLDSARRALHLWSLKGLIEVIGKTEIVRSSRLGRTGVSNQQASAGEYMPHNIWAATELGKSEYEYALSTMD